MLKCKQNILMGVTKMINSPVTTSNRQAMQNAFNTLEEKLNADVFVYYGDLVDGVEADVKQIVEQICNETQKHETLFVLLTTHGGSLSPVKRIVNIFRNFYAEVNFIVPDYAYSAGTVMCCSGDKIYMDYYSVLGPIDPQVMNRDGKFVAALGYLDKIDELIQKAKNNELTNAEFIILKDFDLAELTCLWNGCLNINSRTGLLTPLHKNRCPLKKNGRVQWK